MLLTVGQHIYSNVPREQSPQRKRGYQTLFYTQAALSADLVRQLEDRAQYYGDDVEPLKYQFWLLEGSAVITRLAPLAERDEFGRKGRYLAHSLIIAAADFQRLQASPFPVLAVAPFFSDLAAVFAQGDVRSGNIAPLQLNVDMASWEDEALRLARAWPPAALIAWTRAAWQAAALRQVRQAVRLPGEPASVLAALSVACLLTNPDKRPWLTFDTYTNGCDWRGPDWPFWAWGDLRVEPDAAVLRIDADRRQVAGPALDAAADTPYERWLALEAIPRRLEWFSADRSHALRLAHMLHTSQYDLAGLDERVGQAFARHNAAAVSRAFLAGLPITLSPTAQQALQRHVAGDPWAAVRLLADPRRQAAYAGFLSRWLLTDPRVTLPPEDFKALGGLARATGDVTLAARLALQAGDIAGWQQLVASLPVAQYIDLATAAHRQGLEPETLLVWPHFTEWCRRFGRFLQPGALKNVLRRMDKEAERISADPLLAVLPHLPEDDLSDLTRWVKKHSAQAPQLYQQLVPPADENTSLFNRLKFWRRSGNDDR